MRGRAFAIGVALWISACQSPSVVDDLGTDAGAARTRRSRMRHKTEFGIMPWTCCSRSFAVRDDHAHVVAWSRAASGTRFKTQPSKWPVPGDQDAADSQDRCHELVRAWRQLRLHCLKASLHASMQYTLRNIPKQLDQALRRRAREQGKTLTEVAIEAMAEGVGLTSDVSRRRRSVRDLVGSRAPDPELRAALDDQRTIDSDLWR
jgi:hypothetical protein